MPTLPENRYFPVSFAFAKAWLARLQFAVVYFDTGDHSLGNTFYAARVRVDQDRISLSNDKVEVGRWPFEWWMGGDVFIDVKDMSVRFQRNGKYIEIVPYDKMGKDSGLEGSIFKKGVLKDVPVTLAELS